MRKLIATVFNYSLDGLLADAATDVWEREGRNRSDTILGAS